MDLRPSRKKPCIYCTLTLPLQSLSGHRTLMHREMTFGCRMCPFNADFFDDMQAHARLEHSYNLDGVADPSKIIAAISLPRDLRALSCRLCKHCSGFGKAHRDFLAQDRAVLSSHLRRAHLIEIDVVELKYFCRLCAEEFAHTEAFLMHACCDLNGQSKILPRPLCPELMSTRTPATVSTSTCLPSVSHPEMYFCPYCEARVAHSHRASHNGRHPRLDFQCSSCARSFPFLEKMINHLERQHVEDVRKFCPCVPVCGRHLAENKLLVIPTDLRMLRCPVCPRVILAQDRIALGSHLKSSHGYQHFDKDVVKYACRACHIQNFASSLEVFAHDCMNHVAGGAVNAIAIASRAVPMHSEPSAIQTSGRGGNKDHRILACCLCAYEAHGCGFYAMIRHLEREHQKFQIARDVFLDEFVSFRCSLCPDFRPSNVHHWAKHFDEHKCSMLI